ncbi:hypothetical protein PENARI_c020G07591 [Penicillium arizonense]|uniref:Uncharacterized protein n=1 Tax=Penicillium arizonense TaxID=1835702 RepID=A0A1F5L9B5_PENAI|nr:hypothetical protein PENARI_c020G07591 [Penicillium arizonense]OGE49580.1 hypothetical protein PENARI_c020G07591 [Penicillium arizonense]
MPERNTGLGDGNDAASRKISNGTEDPTCRSIELTCHDYTVGWICALPKEQTAATAMLDQIHSDIPKPPNDPNTYTLGCIGRHNIVITCLPKGKIGNNSAATSAAQMARTFPSIKVGLMVGIGGGIPPRVRLGDVVISVPVAEFPGVVQWDIGKVEEDGFKRIGALNNPPTALLTALTKLETKHEMHGSRIRQYLDDLGSKYPNLVSKYTWSDSLQDPLSSPAVSDHSRSGWQVILFSLWSLVLALYRYLSGSGLLAVDSRAESAVPTVYHDVHNTRRRSADVRVHYGLIASGNKVIKNAVDRDRLNESLGGNVLCVEMEAAGLMNNFPCIVIRGICDYADAQKNKDWQEYAAAIAAACAKELLEHVQPNDVDGERPLKDILGDVNATLQRTDANVKTIRSKLDRKEDLEILDWLTGIDYGPQHSDHLKRRQSGTGQWFLDSVEYQNWRSSSQQTLLGVGIPGAGKTILAAIVIDDLTTRFGHDSSIGIAYIYFNFRQKQQQRREDLVSSLLKQLSQGWPSLPDRVENLYNKHTRKKTRPSFDELCKALLYVAALYSKTFIIVDALDECEVSDGCLSSLLSEIFALQSKAAVNLFATSRPIPEIEERFDGCTLHHISASEEDIRSYLNSHMTRLPEFVLENPELQERVKAGIIDAADGMFLLARLHLDSLIGMKSPKAIEIALKKLPKGSNAYDNAYDEAMERIKGQAPACQKTAEWTLKWITFARRQLSVPELQHALAVEVGETEFDACNISRKAYILSICAGLVTVDEESNIIRLVHYTTQEYFERTRHDLFENAEADLSKVCVSYLSFRAFDSGPCQTRNEFLERLELNKFYDYSANYWGHHAREASSLCPEVTDLLDCEPKVDASSQALLNYDFHDDPQFVKDPRMTGLHLASFFGIGEAIKTMLQQRVEINAEDQEGRTPLSWAAENGRELVVKLLLDRGARLETKDNVFCQTPLSLAAQNGHNLVVKLLLDKGACLETKDNFGQTPLSLAAGNGHDLVVKLLLDKGACLETKDNCGQTPLSLAAGNGHDLVVKLLLDKGACLETKDNCGQTPLLWAARNGHKLVVKLLLDKGADPDVKDDKGQTPLSLAARYGGESVVELLLDKGADPETKD